MSDIKYEELQKGKAVFFARVLPKIGYYEILDLHIVSVHEKYCTGAELKTKKTYSFNRSLAEKVLFLDRNLAIDYLDRKRREDTNRKIIDK